MFMFRTLVLTLGTTALLGACSSSTSAGGGTGITADTTGADGSIGGGEDATTLADGTTGGADATTADDTSTAGTDATTAEDTAAGGTDAASTDTGPNIDNLPCPSNSTYKGGENDNMEPGNACITCHSQQGGPTYKFAGTVFRNLITETGCNSSGGAASVVPPETYTIELTDSTGKVITTKTFNPSGNFHISNKQAGTFTMPYKARVIDSTGKARKMIGAQSDGNCNSCHTAVGVNDAPGRIVAP